jgi:TetR/AcrR family transcriptional repressor of cmeABC operon
VSHATGRTATAKKTARRAAAPAPVPSPSRLAERRRKFVEAAEQLFLERGFAGASVNEVVRIAGGSLATLYAEFGTKEALFEAVLSQRAGAIFEEGVREPAHVADVATELRKLAARMQARILSTDSLAIYRLAVAEAPRFPGLRKTVLESGLRGFLAHLSDYFAELAAAGTLVIAAPALAAEHFLTLVQGQEMFTAGCGEAVTAAERREHVKQAVDAFLKIYPPQSAARKTARKTARTARRAA